MKILILSNTNINFINATCLNPNDISNKLECDILLVCSNVKNINFSINSKILIIYGDLGFHLLNKIKSEKIITYGMSQKNTVTISSFSEENILISILRKFTDINDKIIEIFEYNCEKNKLTDLDCLALSILNLILQ